METTMFPIVKNKCCNLSDSNNYRPIAIATITSKVLESVILVKCEEFLYPSLHTVSLPLIVLQIAFWGETPLARY